MAITPTIIRRLKKIENLYHQAITANPNSAELRANYADYLWHPATDCWIADIGGETDAQQKCLDMIVPGLDAAFRLDSSNETAQELLQRIRDQFPGFTYAFPPTVSPTITPTPTQSLTPSITPTPLPTSTPTNTLRPTSTKTPHPTVTTQPTHTPRPTRTATPITTATSQPSATHQPTTSQPLIAPTAASAQPAASVPSWLAGFLFASLTFTAGIFVGRTFLPKPS